VFSQGGRVVLFEGANSDDFLIVAAERPRRRTIGKRKAADGGRWEKTKARECEQAIEITLATVERIERR